MNYTNDYHILISRRQLTSSKMHFSTLNLVIIQLKGFHFLLMWLYTAQPTVYITWLSLWHCFYWPFLNSPLCSQTDILIQLCSQKKIFIQPTSLIGYVWVTSYVWKNNNFRCYELKLEESEKASSHQEPSLRHSVPSVQYTEDFEG